MDQLACLLKHDSLLSIVLSSTVNYSQLLAHRFFYSLIVYVSCALLMSHAGCGNRSSVAPNPEAGEAITGDARMRRMLNKISSRTADDHPYLGSRLVRTLRLNLEQMNAVAESGREVAPYRSWKLYFDLGKAEMRLGNNEAAIQHLTSAYALMDQVDFSAVASLESYEQEDLNTKYRNRTRFYLGVANLRVAEEENCCLVNNSNSCIVPIRGGGDTHQAARITRCNSIFY